VLVLQRTDALIKLNLQLHHLARVRGLDLAQLVLERAHLALELRIRLGRLAHGIFARLEPRRGGGQVGPRALELAARRLEVQAQLLCFGGQVL
jgi:hypothetical protein